MQLAWKDRRQAGKEDVTFRAGKSDQNRLGSVVPSTRVVATDRVDGDVRRKGALEILLDLLDPYPTLDGAASLTQTYSIAGLRLINRSEVTHALRMIVGGVGRDLFAVRSVLGETQWRHAGIGTRGYGCPNT